MSDDRSNPFYYSAPEIPQADEEMLVDPFEIPSITDREERPGDLFRTYGNASLTDNLANRVQKVQERPRAGKLNWAFGGFSS